MTTYRSTLTRQREKRGRTVALVEDVVLEDVVLEDVVLEDGVELLSGFGDKRLPRVPLRKALKLLSVVKLMTLSCLCLEVFSNERTAA